MDRGRCKLRKSLGVYRSATKSAAAECGGTSHPIDAFVRSRLADRIADASATGIRFRIVSSNLSGPDWSASVASGIVRVSKRTVLRPPLSCYFKSDRFGEKWARHWLDLARYSDTNGYEKDLPREQWSWRDWVIEAINQRYAVRPVSDRTDCRRPVAESNSAANHRDRISAQQHDQ